MRVSLAAVMSADARITQARAANPSAWRSAEDGQVLKQLITDHEVIVMGRKTYETIKPRASDGRLRVVLTTTPEVFTTHVVPGRLEFVSMSAPQLIDWLADRGFQSVLLLGGSSNLAFLQAGLVDDIYLTIEPVLFGSGAPLISSLSSSIALQLRESRQLHPRGTLLLHYTVIKPTPATDGQLSSDASASAGAPI